MELSTIQALAALNQRFYDEHAENFADARPRLAAGVQRVLAGIPPGAHVLEVGCGDGKVGRALARAGVASYLGLDASEAMLARARRYTEKQTEDERRTPRERWGQATNIELSSSVLRPPSPAPHPLGGFVLLSSDLTSPAWPSVLADQFFDHALAFAVFHHLPSEALRAQVLGQMAAHLALGGRIALSNWQFTRSPRTASRLAPWSAAGIDERALEPGDHLLTWERKGRHGLRYVHLLDQPETQRLAAAAGLAITETFSDGGETGDLSDYTILMHA